MPKRKHKPSSETRKHPSGRKRVVNPFAFLLAKRFIDYGFVGMGDEPSDLQFVRYIYDRHKRPGYEETSYTDTPRKRDSVAYSKAESIRKNILKHKETFLFTTKSLNNLVKEIRYPFYNFTSWDDFITHFTHHPAYRVAEFELSEKQSFTKGEIQQFLAHANKELYEHHIYLILCDFKNNPFYSFYNNSFVTRNANAKEIELIEEIEADGGLISKKLFVFLKSNTLFDFKPIFIHKDQYDAPLAYFLLLPLKEGLYKKIRSGEHFIDFLSPSDFIQYDQNEKIKSFYFHLVHNKNIETIYQGNGIKTLKIGIEYLFYKLAELFGELTFGILAERESSVRVVKRLGFKRKEGDNGKSNFYEFSWTKVDSKKVRYKILLNIDIDTSFPFYTLPL